VFSFFFLLLLLFSVLLLLPLDRSQIILFVWKSSFRGHFGLLFVLLDQVGVQKNFGWFQSRSLNEGQVGISEKKKKKKEWSGFAAFGSKSVFVTQ
jgi:ABC-type sugar transport system permease subunit